MTKWHYVLILFFIFPVYLFPQTEENEVIKVDTVIKADTIIIEEPEVDIMVIEVPIKEQDEQIDLGNYIYKDYLDYLKKTTQKTNSFTSDTVDRCKKTCILSARIGGGILAVAFSVSLDIPVSCNTNIVSAYTIGRAGIDGALYINFFEFGLGFILKKSDNFILKTRVCLGSIFGTPGAHFGADIIFRFKFIGLSIGPDFFIDSRKKGTPFPFVISVGLNILRDF